VTSATTQAEQLRVLPAGQLPNDSRLQPPKDLNGYFPFTPSKDVKSWEIRAARLRRQILVSQGLWPLPTKTALNSVVHGKSDMGDYTIEKAYFESLPGFLVTGSLYRPKGKEGKLPAVLCPHGHWSQGRFYANDANRVRTEITQGAERFEDSGRSPLQARCVQLARMGCVVFHYDMIGYADSQQISYEIAHRFAKQRSEMNTPTNWGLFSPQAESHAQSVMGLQTYSSIRAVDFVSSLPDVDASRIAVTGASGGGTQSFMLAAVEPRIAVAFPAVMVSTAMQGGCTCENSSLLRVGTGNVEMAALFAPKPLGVSTANDWTKELPTKGFPDLQKHYDMLGVKNNVMMIHNPHFNHNYNYVSRAAMYHWMNRHLKLGLKTPIVEVDFKRLVDKQLTVYDEKHPRPKGGADFERGLLKWWHDDTASQLATLVPQKADDLGRYLEQIGGGVDIVVGRGLPAASDLEYDQTDKVEVDNYLRIAGTLTNHDRKEQLPIVFFYPKQWEGTVTVWPHVAGKAGLMNNDGTPNADVQALIDAGQAVVTMDMLYQGEFLKDGKPIAKTRRVANPREAAAYTFGYNHSLFAQRVHDILAVVSFVRAHDYTPEKVNLIGVDGAGPWVAAARAQARDAVSRAAIDTKGFRFAEVNDIHSPDFLPGGARYLDLSGMLSLSAPDPLWVAGETPESLANVRQIYKVNGAADNLIQYEGDQKKAAAAAVDWLLKIK
jgi:dienelactone hydrolase